MEGLSSRARTWLGRLEYRAVTGLAKRAARMRTSSVTVMGTQLPCLTGGSGPPAVALHGFGSFKEAWLPVAPALARRAALYLPDLPGFGEAIDGVAPEEVLTERQAERVAGLADVLGLDQLDLMGHSMGGAIALAFARRHPRRVRSLVLVCPAGPQVAPTVVSRCHEQRRPTPLAPRTRDQYERLISLGMHRRPALMGPMLDHLARQHLARAAWLERAFESWYSDHRKTRFDRATLAAIEVPTLIIQGARDQLVHPTNTQDLTDALPDARLLELSGVGHIPQMEAPFATARAITAFLSSLAD